MWRAMGIAERRVAASTPNASTPVTGRRITAVTEDTRETAFLFQRLPVALQRGNAVAFLATFDSV